MRQLRLYAHSEIHIPQDLRYESVGGNALKRPG